MWRISAGIAAVAALVTVSLIFPTFGQESKKSSSKSGTSTTPSKSTTGDKTTGSDGSTTNGSNLAPSKPSGVIRVDKCSIKLIDEVSLASERTGIIKAINVKEGSVVKEGDLLIELKDEVARAAHARAEREAANDVEVRYSKKAYEFALAEHASAVITNMKVPGAVTDIEVKKLKLAAERAELQIENAQNQLEINKYKRDESAAVVDSYLVRAPFGGRINKVHKHVGEAVREGELNPIVDLVDTSRVYVEGNVPVRDIWDIRAGDIVRVNLDIQDADLPQEKEIFEGKVVFIDAKVVLDKIRVRAEVVNRDEILKAGLNATMMIEPRRKAGAETAEKSEGKTTK